LITEISSRNPSSSSAVSKKQDSRVQVIYELGRLARFILATSIAIVTQQKLAVVISVDDPPRFTKLPKNMARGERLLVKIVGKKKLGMRYLVGS
jgi:hypothetical protein